MNEFKTAIDMLVGDFNPNHDPENGQFTTGPGGVKWQPSKGKLPKEGQPVNVTWVNHKLRGKPMVSTAALLRGRWHWWSYDGPSGPNIGKNIEVIAWAPLPEPYVED